MESWMTTPETGSSAVNAASSTRAVPQPRRVLVVDDEPDIRESVADVLTSAGYLVDMAPHGLAALEQIRRQPVDLVLIDLMMPVMDGWAFRKQVRSDPLTAHVPVVAVSAITDREAEKTFNGCL